MRRLLPLVLLAVVSCSSDPEPAPKPSIDGVETFTGLSHDHIQHADQYPVDYAQTPPVGGLHSKAWLRCDVYDEPVPNENAVHSMEHGAVWVTYRPDLDAASVTALQQLAGANVNYVLVSPYPDLPAPVVASSWQLQLEVQSATDPRLLEMVRTYAGGNQGGEQGADCRNTGLTPEKAREFDAKADQ